MSGVRWVIRSSVLRVLQSMPEEHWLRRFVVHARRVGPLRSAWHGVASNVDGWRDVARYTDGGGVFAPSRCADRPAALPDAEDPAFFDRLLAAADACETPYRAEPSRVLLVSNGLPAGGAERQIVYTARGLKAQGLKAQGLNAQGAAARGCDVSFVGDNLGRVPGADFHRPALEAAGVPARPLTRRCAPGKQTYSAVTRPVAEALAQLPVDVMIDVLDMIAELREIRPEVVHLWLDDSSTKYGLAAAIAGAPRIVLSGRNVNPTHFEFHRPYMRAVYRALAGRSSVVLSNNSRAGAESYAAWLALPAQDIRVVYNAVDPALWPKLDPAARRAARIRFGAAEGERLVVGAFRMSPEKRPLLWLETARAALDRDASLRFALAGDGPMRGEVERRVEALGLANRLLLSREIPDVAALLGAADALLMTSEQEGTPNVLLEAQWLGTPSLITDAGGSAEAVLDGVTGRVSRSSAPEDLAAMLIELMNDPALAASTKVRGPGFVAERFGFERLIAETLSLYWPD